MGTRPTNVPTWATGGSAVVIEPSTAKKDEGFVTNEQPAPAHWNWLQNNVGKWIDYLRTLDIRTWVPATPSTSQHGSSSGRQSIDVMGVDRAAHWAAVSGAATHSSGSGYSVRRIRMAEGVPLEIVEDNAVAAAGTNITAIGIDTTTGEIVAARSDNEIFSHASATSSSAQSWTQASTPPDVQTQWIACDGSRWVAVGLNGGSGEIWYTDAPAGTWSVGSAAPTGHMRHVVHANSRWIASGNLGNVYVSSDGASWGSSIAPDSRDWYAADYDSLRDLWTIVGEDGGIFCSSGNPTASGDWSQEGSDFSGLTIQGVVATRRGHLATGVTSDGRYLLFSADPGKGQAWEVIPMAPGLHPAGSLYKFEGALKDTSYQADDEILSYASDVLTKCLAG